MWRFLLAMSFAFAIAAGFPPTGLAQGSEIVSEHIRMGIPLERQWLGREVISELERFWRYVNSVVDGNMPRRVVVSVRWDVSSSWTSPNDNRITVGMDQPVSGPDLRSFFFKQTARELARLGLMKLARQAAPVDRTEFLIQGMAEILVHEFDRSTRVLGGAWIIANLLDQAGLLGFEQQSDWARYSLGRHNLRSAAPGVTFLITSREIHGREKTMKLFESLRSRNLEDSLSSTFRSSAAALEGAWLKKVREQPAWEDVTTTSSEDAPILEKTALVPGVVRPGQTIRVNLLLRDRTNDLPHESVFLRERMSGKVYTGKAGPDGSTYVEIPVDGAHAAGSYGYRITAVDDSGNVRNWDGEYVVGSPGQVSSPGK